MNVGQQENVSRETRPGVSRWAKKRAEHRATNTTRTCTTCSTCRPLVLFPKFVDGRHSSLCQLCTSEGRKKNTGNDWLVARSKKSARRVKSLKLSRMRAGT